MEDYLPYDKNNKHSIIEYAKRLIGKSLGDVCFKSLEESTEPTESGEYGVDVYNKGRFGQALEKYYFHYEPNSNSKPDFEEAGLELKSSPIKKNKDGSFKSKERLVLNIINYEEVVKQEFNSSSFFEKNANILLVFYLYEVKKTVFDYRVKLVDEWSFPKTDLLFIKRDWEFIKAKILAGKAHELSEGDTFYLGACTKGSKGGNLRTQPESDILAKQRAFSFKQGYVNHIIATLANDSMGKYGKLITQENVQAVFNIEEYVTRKFEKFYGKTVKQLTEEFGLQNLTKAKNFYACLTKVVLGIGVDQEIEEFEKAGITIKTVRLKENGLPKEDISFPSFKYEELIVEDWIDSPTREAFEKKFLFVFYQFEGENLILKRVRFWNMPYADLQSVKDVWSKTKELVKSGRIVQKIVNDIRYTYFPLKSKNRVSHVRPHATNNQDTYPLPVPDQLTGLRAYTKHCFWLNASYVRDEILLK